MYLTLSWKTTLDKTLHVMELIKCICIQHFNSFSIFQAKINEIQKRKCITARSSLTSVVFASCLLLPIKDRILGNANEKT